MASQVWVYILTIFGTAVLSRLITPSEFGLFGMITVLVNLANMVVAMGVSMAIIQGKTLISKDLSSLFWFNMIIAFVMAIIFFLGAPIISDFFDQPHLIPISRWFCIVFLLHGANAVPLGILSKRISFKEIAYGHILGTAVSYMIAIGFAIKDYGAFSLVFQVILMNLIILTFNLYYAKWRPSFIFKKEALLKVKNFSLNFLPSQLIDFFATNLDMVLIGKYLGAREVGFYGKAMALVMLPFNLVSMVFNKSFYPIFSKFQDDVPVIKNIYLKSSKMMSLILIPLYTLIIIQAEDAIIILFGSQWTEAAPLVEVLGLFAIFYSLNSFNDTFILSQGKSNWLLKVNIADKIILVSLFVLALQFGLIFFAYAKLIVTFFSFILKFILASVIHKITLLSWIKSLNKIIASFGLLLLIAFFSKLFFEDQHLLLRVFTLTSFSLTGFFVMLYILKEDSFEEILNILRNYKKGSSY